MGYGQFSRYYDALTGNIDYRTRAAYFDGLIREQKPDAKLLLDLCCGTGSLSVELAVLGYDVIGADASQEMLSVAMGKAAETERSILFLHQDARRLDLYGTVDACVCALDSLNHLPDGEALACVFERVSLFLEPGGVFLFDLNTPYKHREILGNNSFVYDLEEVFCVWQSEYIAEKAGVEITLDFFEECGKEQYRRTTEHLEERGFEDATVRRLLAESGLIFHARYAADTKEPPAQNTQRVVYVAIGTDHKKKRN